MVIVGRKRETKKLGSILNSKKSELVAVYGRRRVGKTYLINTYFKQEKCHLFTATGIEKGSYLEQRTMFCRRIAEVFYDGINLQVPKTWFDVFELLTKALDQVDAKQNIVLFFDEFPWMVTPRSRMLQAFEYYWNQYWSKNPRIKLIICGSLASWILKQVVNNTGGLYQRVTHRMKIHPFNLNQTKAFLKYKTIKLTHQQITKLYMVTGGIPLYLEHAQKGLSADEVIDQLCFQTDGLLTDELDELFKSLFKQAKLYKRITREISKHLHGISKSQLSTKLRYTQGGGFDDCLQDLEDAGFITSFLPYQHIAKGTYYRINDEYVFFYFQWIEKFKKTMTSLSQPKGVWLDLINQGKYHHWRGYAFEMICYQHIAQIMQKLQLSAASLPHTWKHTTKSDEGSGAQIDLLFERKDDAITLCEIKYTDSPFIIDKSCAQSMVNKRKAFLAKTATKKQISFALISANGLRENLYADDIIDNIVVLDDLFET